MNGSGRGGMPYGLPSGPASLRSGPRAPAPPPPNQPAMAKAEQFADEKLRIENSCFSKRDPDGELSERYITHIRITEDSRYPTSPPPPNSPPENKKERVILLAVRSTGRVRMHKARENPNGTFSVGKTWNFEDLSIVESFRNRVPRSAEEAEQFRWAGDTGFAVTIQKPYFWQTNSAMEKSYFIGSVVKVYKRYTEGRLPQLIGFTPAEMDQIFAQADQPTAAGQSYQASVAPGRAASADRGAAGRSLPQVSSAMPGAPPPLNARRGATLPAQDRPSQPPEALRVGQLRPTQSREQVRPYTPPGRTTPSSEQNRSPTPESQKAGVGRRGGFYQTPGETGASPTNGLGISDSGPKKTNGDSTRLQTRDLPEPPLTIPPERKRPPLAPSADRFSDSSKQKPLPIVRDVDRPIKEPNKISPPVKSPDRYAVQSGSMETAEKTTPPPAKTEEAAKEAKPEEAAKPDGEQGGAEEARPGLGRMFGGNKKTTRELFSKAATAYNAFKPRAGGAAAKLLASEPKSNEPDGITGVVPAPSLARTKTTDSTRSGGSQDQSSIQHTPISAIGKKSIPDFKVTSPQTPSDKPAVSSTADMITSQKLLDMQQKVAGLQQQTKAAEEEAAKRKLRRTPQQIKYLERLGVDPALLEGRGLEYEALLDEFWSPSVWHTKSVETLQAELRRELSRAQTSSWFDHLDRHEEERQDALRLIETTIKECDDLEKLLTIYSVELSGLSDDIAYIEAQHQGLQVMTANQKLLRDFLKNLLDTVMIPPQKLEPIVSGNIIKLDGLESVERALLLLYNALALIDPSIMPPDDSEEAKERAQLSKMRALQEKRGPYMVVNANFLKRLKNYMDIIYGQTAMEVQAAAKSGSKAAHLTVEFVNAGRTSLWRYSPLMLYAKQLDKTVWMDLLRGYQARMRTLYSDALASSMKDCKNMVRGAPVDDQDVLFTANEHQDGLAIAARKMTVKRSQTLARTLRASSGDKALRRAGSQSGTFYPWEAVDHALGEITPILLSEQSFLIDFFHASTTETMDFAEAVQASLPENRRGPADPMRKQYEPDQDMVQLVANVMNDMFGFLPTELQSLVGWATGVGALQGVGVLHALHQKMGIVDDGFFYRALHTLSTRLTNDWTRFLSAQIRAIEDTKVKIKKRSGVIYFMRVFPHFSAHIEGMLPPASEVKGEVRELVDEAYRQVIKAMFDSLRAIAKEAPSTAPHAAAGDPEDKEALNYHILLIENMNHYVENVDVRDDEVLTDGSRKAREELDEHLSLYVDAVIRRPLGKIMDFTDSLAHALDALGAGTAPASLATKPAFAPHVPRKLAAAHEPRELRRAVDALRRRVEKHFSGESASMTAAAATFAGSVVAATSAAPAQAAGGDGDTARALMAKVLAGCEERFAKEVERFRTVPKPVYGDEFAGVAVSREEVAKWFGGAR